MRFCHIVSLDEGHIAGLNSQEDEEIHYASVTVAGCSQGETGWKIALTSVFFTVRNVCQIYDYDYFSRN